MLKLKSFEHHNAKSVNEAGLLLAKYEGKASVIAGGTDLLGSMKVGILPRHPEALINIKTIPGLSYIKEEGDTLKIGALTTLADIAENSALKDEYTALAQAAALAASPLIREMGTIAGNICQMNRCWYFRNADFPCKMNDGKMCYAPGGDNRYHSIFKGVKGCFAVNPSDTAPALLAFDAKIKTNKRTIDVKDFWAMGVSGSTVLEVDEIVTEIQIPKPAAGTKSAFLRYTLKASIDFPIVNCAAAISSGDARICLNAVHPHPYRAYVAEEAIKGKVIDEASADAAGEAAVKGAFPLSKNKYKVQIAKTMVKRTILACE